MDRSTDLWTFGRGDNFHLQEYLGAHKETRGEQEGFTFRVWAPNAQAVDLIGDFTDWEARKIPMVRNEGGVWEVFCSDAKEGDIYKYLVTRQNGHQVQKIDPLALWMEKRPNTGSIIKTIPEKNWKDGLWRARRKKLGFKERPVNIYEVHAGSWKRNEDHSSYTFKQLKEELIPYLVEMNYTHVEFMPVMAHPLGLSWGYQLMGYFALEQTYGSPEEFQDFVEECHLNNIGVIVDWVPGHFIINDDALAYYDGTPTFEYQDEHRAHNYGWGALNFDLGKNQVQSFLISSLKFWIDTYHLDGIRVDAVSNMLYLDYDSGPWTPNIDGGNLNYEGVHFLRRLNAIIKNEHPDVMMIAEESSAGQKITGPEEEGGLGFDYKWNMGWMNDSLDYVEVDPYFRQGCHHRLTFSMCYAFVENFILPISHDEVVHGKKSLLDKAPVNYEEKFSHYKAFLGYMFGHPGKKLTFMGSEIPQFIEWDEKRELDWFLLDYPLHQSTHRFVQELNQFYKVSPALWEHDGGWAGFEWHVVEDASHNVFAFSRKAEQQEVLVISNFSGQNWDSYHIGFETERHYKMALNSDAKKFGGQGVLNRNLKTVQQICGELPFTLKINIPAFSTLYLERID